MPASQKIKKPAHQPLSIVTKKGSTPGFQKVPHLFLSSEEERTILRRFRLVSPLDDLASVVPAAELLEAQRACRGVHVAAPVEEYLLAVVRATREHPAVELGASPRASLALYRAAQALAAVRGRAFVIPDDVKRLAAPVLTHRLILASGSRLRGRDRESIVAGILDSTPVPVEDAA